jgi:hypothetical protein
LEFLDEITRQKYNRKLDQSIIGEHRVELINSFRNVFGTSYIPPNLYKSLKWSTNDPFICDEIIHDWKIIDLNNKNGKVKPSDSVKEQQLIVVADGAKSCKTSHTEVTLHSMKKRGRESDGTTIKPLTKNIKLPVENEISGHGPQWHMNSCAYDSILSIFMHIWSSNVNRWTEYFQHINNEYIHMIQNGLNEWSLGEITINNVREDFRLLIHDTRGQNETFQY